jgi:hypothetical protein
MGSCGTEAATGFLSLRTSGIGTTFPDEALSNLQGLSDHLRSHCHSAAAVVVDCKNIDVTFAVPASTGGVSGFDVKDLAQVR